MRRIPCWLALIAGLLSLAAPPRVAHADSNPVIVDERWVAPDFAQRNPHRIAVLPAVTFDAFPQSHLASDLFFNTFLDDGHTWLQPTLCRLLYGSSVQERDSVLRAVSEQVRQHGHTDTLTTRAIARRLRADAILFLRVDRWEHVLQPTDATNIELHGELVDSTGAPLVRLVSRSRVFGQALHSNIDMSAPAQRNMEAPSGSSNQSPTSSLQAAAPPAGRGGANALKPIARIASEEDAPFEAPLVALFNVWKTIVPAATAPPATPAR